MKTMLNLLVSLLLIFAFAVAPITQAQEEEELTKKVAQALEELTQKLAQMHVAQAQVKEEGKKAQEQLLLHLQASYAQAKANAQQAQSELQKLREKDETTILLCIAMHGMQEQLDSAQRSVKYGRQRITENLQEPLRTIERTKLEQAQQLEQQTQAELQEVRRRLGDDAWTCLVFKKQQDEMGYYLNREFQFQDQIQKQMRGMQLLMVKEQVEAEALTEALTEALKELTDALR